MRFCFRVSALALCSIVLGLPVALGQLTPDPEQANTTEPTIRTVTSQHFEVVGLDKRSVAHMDQLSQYVVDVFETYFPTPEAGYPQKILIALRPLNHANFEGSYRVRPRERGFVDLDLRWTPDLEMESVCRAIAEACAVRYTHYYGGPSAVTQYKNWVVSAVGTLGYVSLRPAQIVALTRDAQSHDFSRVDALLERSGNLESKAREREGYWFLMALREAGFDRKVQIEFMRQGLSGNTAVQKLQTRLPQDALTGEKIHIEEWWSGTLEILLEDPAERYETLNESQRWIKELSDFAVYREEVGDFDNLRSLWKQRENPALREVLSARSQIIRLKLARVNPAYFNAARSLGALFESALEGGKPHEFIGNLAAFLTDYEDIRRMHQLVESELGG